MKGISVCIRCGAEKRARPSVECPACGFQPRSPEDKAKSVILSTHYEIDGEFRGHTRETLRDIAARVETGKYVFDPDEVATVAEYGESVAAITRRGLIIDGIKWLGPPLLFLAALLTAAWLSRHSL